MPAAVPKKPRPHQDSHQQPTRAESLKQRLVQQIAMGDANGAESTRAKIQHERLQKRIEEMETAANSAPESSTVHWVSNDGAEESIEMTATPEAKAYFSEVMKKEVEA